MFALDFIAKHIPRPDLSMNIRIKETADELARRKQAQEQTTAKKSGSTAPQGQEAQAEKSGGEQKK